MDLRPRRLFLVTVIIEKSGGLVIIAEIIQLGLPILKTHLHDRQAYRLMARRHLGLFDLDDEKVANLGKAQDNAVQLTRDVLAAMGVVA